LTSYFTIDDWPSKVYFFIGGATVISQDRKAMVIPVGDRKQYSAKEQLKYMMTSYLE
jgi:hypothetical protein